MQVDILVQRGQAAGCSDSVGDLQTKVQTIQDSCCVQNGANVCTDGGGPDRCNAACALAFIPYYVQCVEAPTHGVVLPSASAAGDVRVFSLLFSQCTEHLAANETSILLSLVRDRDEEATCSIDTGSILTLSEAKAGPPPCETDVSRMCHIVITSGTFTCADNFCAVCDQPHSCDNTCQFPCGDGNGPPPPPAVCQSDTSQMCDGAIAAGTMTCESDFCASCGQAGMCDHTCGLPCSDGPGAGGSGGDGGHRLLAEELFPTVFQTSTSCSWDALDDAVRHISTVCCGDEHGCSSGLPEVCSYECGKIFVPFLDQCGDTLEKIIAYDESATMQGYRTLRSQCLQLDPETMVLAIDGSVCVTCGDGEVAAGEEDCDDGLDGNSDAPDAHCRLDCHLARCGDGIVDSGEECDAGARNGCVCAGQTGSAGVGGADCTPLVADPNWGDNGYAGKVMEVQFYVC